MADSSEGGEQLKNMFPHLRALGMMTGGVLADFIHRGIDRALGRETVIEVEGLTEANIDIVVQELSVFAMLAAGHEWNKAKIFEELRGAKVAEESFQIVADSIIARIPELRLSLVNSPSMSHCVLNDFDWKINVRIDKMSDLNVPVCLLKLLLKDERDEKSRDVLLELTKGDLDMLLKDLEAANSGIQKLKA